MEQSVSVGIADGIWLFSSILLTICIQGQRMLTLAELETKIQQGMKELEKMLG